MILCSGGNFDNLIWTHVIRKDSTVYDLNLPFNVMSFKFSKFCISMIHSLLSYGLNKLPSFPLTQCLSEEG